MHFKHKYIFDLYSMHSKQIKRDITLNFNIILPVYTADLQSGN